MPFITINDEITSRNLNKIYRNTDCIFFYHWNSCGHCHQFKPIFYDVIHELMDDHKDFMNKAHIFQIELDNFNLLPENLKQIQAFPSVITYSNGKKIGEFSDQRTKPNLTKYILSSLGERSATYKGKSSSSSKKKRVIKKYSTPKTV